MQYRSLSSQGIKVESDFKSVPSGTYAAILSIVKMKATSKPELGDEFLLLGYELENLPENGASMIFENIYLNHTDEDKRNKICYHFEKDTLSKLLGGVPDHVSDSALRGLRVRIEVAEQLVNGKKYSKIVDKERISEDTSDQLNQHIPF